METYLSRKSGYEKRHSPVMSPGIVAPALLRYLHFLCRIFLDAEQRGDAFLWTSVVLSPLLAVFSSAFEPSPPAATFPEKCQMPLDGTL